MEAKLNIANILKDKPSGTKLYADAFGELKLERVKVNEVISIFVKTKRSVSYSFYSNGRYTKEGEPILVPSKKMRDWNKFAWKKGDVLTNSSGFQIFFDKWVNEDYTEFLGKIKLLGDSHCYDTAYYTLASEEEALEFIKSVEEINNGKLNRETLEIEKQTEFKDGDIIKMTWDKYSAITIFWKYSNFGKGFDSHVFFNIKKKIIEYNIHGYTPQDMILRLATEEEKQQLFDALEKENKAWDAKHKTIVDLKPKWWTPKPFDRVITRVDDDDIWTANIFSHIDSYGEYVTIGCVGGYHYCLPYNDETAKLIGTTNNWRG